ncbi:MAG: sporulation protein YqfD [Clostridia bacterium]|nr:sporulation protein YqfD [Clostridia bacterium]
MFKRNKLLSHGEKVTIEIDCNNRSRLLNALKKSGIRVFKAKITPKKKLQITILGAKSEKTFAICDNMCYTYRVCSSFGARTRLTSLVKRVGFIVGALVVATVSLFTFDRYLSLEIYGLQSLTKSEIIEHLKNGGITVGAKKSEISHTAVIERMLKLDGVANCEVTIKGGALIIRVVEETKATDRPQIKSAIVSDCNGRVSKIVCRSGTVKVKVGQIVKVGQTLIEGALYGSVGELLETVTANGEVLIETNHTAIYYASEPFYETVYTGNETTVTQIGIFGLTLFGAKSPYEEYQATTTTQVLRGIIPIRVRQTRYRQTKRVKSTKTVDDWASELTEQTAKSLISDDEKVLQSKYDAQKVGQNEYQITVVVTTERKIS